MLRGLRLFLLLGACLLVASPTLAESSKLDPHARAAVADLESGASVAQLRAAGASVTETGMVDCFIEGSVSRTELEALGVRVRTALPGIYTADVPVDVMDQVAALSTVTGVRGAVLCEPYLDVSVPTTGANLLRGAGPAFTGTNGAGVLVGDVDSGIDIHHDDFKDASGLSRILYVWDQNNTTSVVPPAGYTYGHEWLKADIDGGTCTETDGGTLASGAGHGSHVMGIAAGDGSAGTTPYTYAGMAPKANIAMVATTFYDSAILDGVAYIMGRAAALGQNCVVNLSLGSQYGPHDGSSAFESGLDALSGPGRVICVAAGNDRATAASGYIHGGMDVPATGDSMKFTVTGGTTSGRGAEFNGWYNAPDYMTVKLRTPGNLIITLTPGQSYGVLSGTTGWPTNNTGVNGRVYMENAISWSSNGAREIYLIIQSSGSGTGSINGTWTVYCTPTSMSGPTSRVDMWRDYLSTTSLGAYFSLKQSNDHITAEPSNARRVITVAAWETKNSWVSCNGGSTYSYTSPAALGNICTFSGAGPSRDGYQKPDIAAPGMGIGSVRSADATGTCAAYVYQLNDGAVHTINQGTSMAAPHVAGATALLFQKFGAWTPEQVKTYLAANATVDAYTGVPWNNSFGYGKLHFGDLINPVVAVTAPNGGEVFVSGTTENLSWTATDNAGVTSVDLLLSRNGVGGTYETVALGVANSGSYAWTVTLPASDDCWLKVVAHDAAGNTGSDVSNMMFAIVEPVVPTLMTEFVAEAVASGIELRWAFSDPAAFTSVRVERATTSEGPWTVLPVDVRVEDGTSIAVDGAAQSGTTYWYRISAVSGGTNLTFGPIQATAGEVIVAFGLSRPMPNPSSGRVRVEFAVPHQASVELGLYDMQGRRVATLVDGTMTAGRHQAVWDGVADGRSAPAGIYFLRLRAPGTVLSRRLIVTR
jgi:subtilisin family serine protease